MQIVRFKLNKDIYLIFDFDQNPFLLGPKISESKKINKLKALLFHYFKELKTFTLEDILALHHKDSNPSPKERVLIKTAFEWFKANNYLIDEKQTLNYDDQLNVNYCFQDDKGNELSLCANVFNNSIPRQWCYALSFQLNTYPSLLRDGLFYGACFQNLEHISSLIFSELKECEQGLKNNFNFNLSKYAPTKINKRSLWKLHQAFEDYYPKVLDLLNQSPNHKELKELGQSMKNLNYYIHMAEDLLNDWEGGFVEVIFDNHTRPIPISFTEHNNQAFSTELKENHIYLNYFQIGYSVLAAFEAGTDSKPNPQASFCANHFLYFRPSNDLLSKDNFVQVKDWLKTTHDLEINDPHLRLGHIPLAKFTDYSNYEEVLKKISNKHRLTSISIDQIKES